MTPSDPRFWYVSAETRLGIAGAVGWSLDDATLRALAEAVERYCGAQPGQVYKARRADVERTGDLVLTSDPRSSEILTWVSGRSLVTGRRAWVSASMVYLLPFDGTSGTTSTGLAAGRTLDEATMAAACELIERDALMTFWLYNRPARRIDPRLLGANASEAALRHIVAGARITLLDITSDFRLPTFAAFALRDRGPAACIGASCGSTAALAAEKALMEAAHGHYLANLLQKVRPSYEPSSDFHEVRDFVSRALLYSHPRMGSALAPLLTQPSGERVDTASYALVDVVNAFRAHEYELVQVDLTGSDIASLGLRVVRCVAPELQTMEASHVDRRVMLGRAPAGWRGTVNPLPHPMP